MSATITPKQIILVFRDRTYSMPTLDELRKEFGDTESLNLPDFGLDLREEDR